MQHLVLPAVGLGGGPSSFPHKEVQGAQSRRVADALGVQIASCVARKSNPGHPSSDCSSGTQSSIGPGPMLGSSADPLLLRNPWPLEQYTSGVVKTFDGALATARGLWLKADDEADWRDDIFYGLAAAYGVVGLVALVRSLVSPIRQPLYRTRRHPFFQHNSCFKCARFLVMSQCAGVRLDAVLLHSPSPSVFIHALRLLGLLSSPFSHVLVQIQLISLPAGPPSTT